MGVDSMFLEEQLEYVTGEVYKQDFPEMLMGSGGLIPISTAVPKGAETYSFQLMTAVGEAVVLANGTEDIPEVDVYMSKRIGYVRTFANSYSYTLMDLEAAEFAGVSINSEKAVAAREVLERKFDLMAYHGAENYQLLGWLNYPNVPSETIANDGNQNGGVNSTRWRHKTAAQIYRDLRQFALATRVATNSVEMLEIICIDEENFNIINSTPFQAGVDTTIYEYFMRTQASLPSGVRSIIPIPYLAGRGTGGTGLMIGYRRREDKIKLHLPLGFEQRPVQEQGFSFKVNCRMKSGGVQITKPMSMRYGNGI